MTVSPTDLAPPPCRVRTGTADEGVSILKYIVSFLPRCLKSLAIVVLEISCFHRSKLEHDRVWGTSADGSLRQFAFSCLWGEAVRTCLELIRHPPVGQMLAVLDLTLARIIGVAARGPDDSRAGLFCACYQRAFGKY
jgi:hypothetical protein